MKYWWKDRNRLEGKRLSIWREVIKKIRRRVKKKVKIW